jgi:hypothetical protein
MGECCMVNSHKLVVNFNEEKQTINGSSLINEYHDMELKKPWRKDCRLCDSISGGQIHISARGGLLRCLRLSVS